LNTGLNAGGNRGLGVGLPEESEFRVVLSGVVDFTRVGKFDFAYCKEYYPSYEIKHDD